MACIKITALLIPVQGYNRSKEYIAAQGPLPDTLGDFWRMIWDYNVPAIVMLTNLVEKGKTKCSQYWPQASHQEYANIKVTFVNTITQADFVIRCFKIEKVKINSRSTTVLVLTIIIGHCLVDGF